MEIFAGGGTVTARKVAAVSEVIVGLWESQDLEVDVLAAGGRNALVFARTFSYDTTVGAILWCEVMAEALMDIVRGLKLQKRKREGGKGCGV